jgi:hypothetical protein
METEQEAQGDTVKFARCWKSDFPAQNVLIAGRVNVDPGTELKEPIWQ